MVTVSGYSVTVVTPSPWLQLGAGWVATPPLRSSACLAEGSEEVGYVGREDGLLLHTEEEGELGVVGEGLGAEDVCVMLEEGGGGGEK